VWLWAPLQSPVLSESTEKEAGQIDHPSPVEEELLALQMSRVSTQSGSAEASAEALEEVEANRAEVLIFAGPIEKMHCEPSGHQHLLIFFAPQQDQRMAEALAEKTTKRQEQIKKILNSCGSRKQVLSDPFGFPLSRE